MSKLSNELIKFWEYISGPDLWLAIGSAVFRIVLILIIATFIIRMSKKIIYQVFSDHKKKRATPIRITARRENTLKKLSANVISYVVYFIAFIMILDNVLGFNVGALLAGAGVAGLAIGFGAQNLVRDIISGFFIIFEDQFSVDDYVLVSGVEGTVEEIGLRTTKILSWTGEMNVLPNGDITQVTNYSVNNGLSVVDINIPYESDIDIAERIIEDIAKTLPKKYEEIVSEPEILGVQSLEESHFIIRVVAETEPSFQWFGERMIRKEMKEGLYSQGIDIPSPRLVMYSRKERATVLEEQREQN